MNKLKTTGKFFLVLGVLHIFKREQGLNGFGGYRENTIEILSISLVLIVFGWLLIVLANKFVKN